MMKFRLALRFGSFLVLAALPAAGQFPPQLSLQLNASNAQVSVTADKGSPVTLQYNTNLTSGPWLTLSNFTLSASPAGFVDSTDSTITQRFYRAVSIVTTNFAW